MKSITGRVSAAVRRAWESSALRVEYGMALLELSQKAATLYPNKTIEQKRLIMSEMFHNISASGNVVSVKLTKLAEAIAEKAQETRDKLGGPKSDEREAKNDLDNSSDEGHSDLENKLRSSWLGMRDIFQLFPELDIDSKELERRIFEVKQLLDDPSESV